jgi:hypothetical protein
VAVRIDVPAFRGSIPAGVAAAADRLLRDGGVSDLEAVGGGARAVVSDGGIRFLPWVGVVDRALTGDCDCAEWSADDDFCAHAAAVALTALDADVKFSAEGRPHGAGPIEPEPAGYVKAVHCLGPRELTDLVVEQAMRDRLFATRLLGRAGMLDPVDESALAEFQAVIREASAATTGTTWEIADLEHAGQSLVAEVEILRARPVVPAMLDLVEQAIVVWDELAGYLIDAHYTRRIHPDEISEPLTDAYRDLCESLDLDPEEIADRLTRLLDRCQNGVVDLAAFAEVLGEHADRVRGTRSAPAP